MYEYQCVVRRWIDGDSCICDISLGFDTWICDQRIRLNGVDTPELRTRDSEIKKHAIQAKKFVQDFVPIGEKVIIRTSKKGKFGRYLGDFKVKNRWLCNALIAAYLAVPYEGQNKAEILEQHSENRKKLNAK